MIPASPVGWFARFFARHARSRIFATFGQVHVAGLAALAAELERGPVLLVANHSSWWDPLVALWITRDEIGADAYAMMDAANLRRLPFFGKVGAFGVDLAEARDGARAIRYAAKLLDRPGRLVLVYPEGRERSPFSALELRPGAAAVTRIARVPFVPLATRYVFAGEEKPELWIAIGARQEPTGDIAAALGHELARIDGALDARDPAGFTLLHHEPPSRFGRFAERALAWFTRFF